MDASYAPQFGRWISLATTTATAATTTTTTKTTNDDDDDNDDAAGCEKFCSPGRQL